MSFLDVSREYLSRLSVKYECVQHAPVKSTYDIAEKAGVPLAQLAITVLLADEQGSMLVTLPAQHGLDFEAINLQLNRQASLAPSSQYRTRLKGFPATLLPPWHHLFGLPLIVEQSLLGMGEIYLPSGVDGMSFKLSQAEFRRLVKGSSTARFGRVPEHIVVDEDDLTQAEFQDPDQVGQEAESQPGAGSLRERMASDEAVELPVLPKLAKQLLALKAKEDKDPVEIAHAIEQDPVVSGLILRYAGSSLFAYQGKLASVKEAIYHVLGAANALDIAIGASIGKVFKGPKDGPLGLLSLWMNAIYSAALMQQLAAKVSPEHKLHSGTAYLAGLFHNIGYLVLAGSFPSEHVLLNRLLAHNGDASLLELEAKTLDMPHTELGYELMKSWGLANVFQAVVAHHHDSEYSGEHACYVHLACLVDSLLAQQGLGDAENPEPDSRLLLKYDLSEDDLTDCLDKVLEVSGALNSMAGQIAA